MDTAQDLKPKPKMKTIVIGIVIVLIVTLSVVAVVMLSRTNERDLGHDGSVTRSTIPGGFKFPFEQMSKKTPWSDVTILLSDGSNTASWSPLTTDLDNGTAARWNYIAATANVGTLKVNVSIVDLAGNGYIDAGDYFTLTVGTGQIFSSTTTYTGTVMNDPASAEICHWTFQG